MARCNELLNQKEIEAIPVAKVSSNLKFNHFVVFATLLVPCDKSHTVVSAGSLVIGKRTTQSLVF